LGFYRLRRVYTTVRDASDEYLAGLARHIPLDGLIKALTAMVSLATAGLLIPLLPHLVHLRSPARLAVANQTLAQDQEKLFQEFSQIDRSRDRNDRMGLGLHLSQKSAALSTGVSGSKVRSVGSKVRSVKEARSN
jgi:hypothetical protein